MWSPHRVSVAKVAETAVHVVKTAMTVAQEGILNLTTNEFKKTAA
jgi:hypothetical protein